MRTLTLQERLARADEVAEYKALERLRKDVDDFEPLVQGGQGRDYEAVVDTAVVTCALIAICILGMASFALCYTGHWIVGALVASAAVGAWLVARSVPGRAD